MTTPELHLDTAFVRDERGRLVSTREPGATAGPRFTIVRSSARSVWSVHRDVPADIARRLEQLAREEPPLDDVRAPPRHADAYRRLVEADLAARAGHSVEPLELSGPAMCFPDVLPPVRDVVRIEDERLLAAEFRGWTEGEIAAGRGPMFAVVEDGHPVSVCFCARTSETAAEAGLETAARYRGRGYALRVTTAWAHAIRASGRVPLYSTEWPNEASLAVARKLGLSTYASIWSLLEPRRR